MPTLAHPWLLLLLAVPLITRRLLPPHREERQAVRAPWMQRVTSLLGIKPSEGAVIIEAEPGQRITFWIVWCLVVLALARPQLLEDPISRVTPSRDMMLLVDLSGSMEATDFTNAAGDTVDRLAAVKEVLDDFLTRREGDRVGLIVFGNAAFVQVPFTQDLDACRILLNETAVRMAGPRTAFGDAIGLAITLFERSEIEDRVIIALTDGNDTSSKIPPAEAAKIAEDKDITIHVVGVGDPSAVGEEALDEEALSAVAATTGGQFFHASDRDQLSGIYDELDKIEARDIQSESWHPRRDLFHWPLAVALVLTLLTHTLGIWRSARHRAAVRAPAPTAPTTPA